MTDLSKTENVLHFLFYCLFYFILKNDLFSNVIDVYSDFFN